MEKRPILIQGAIDIEINYLKEILKEKEEIEIGTLCNVEYLFEISRALSTIASSSRTNPFCGTCISTSKLRCPNPKRTLKKSSSSGVRSHRRCF